MNNIVNPVVFNAIASMDREQLNAVINAINIRRDFLTQMATTAINPGDKVWFDGGKGRGPIHGTVKKVNRKTVIVHAADGMTWRVSPPLINKK